MSNEFVKKFQSQETLESAIKFLWAAALLTLPVTSFRWFPFLGDTTYVRPMSLYPLAVLIPLLLIQWRRGKRLNWSGALIPLGMLILFLFTATSIGFLLDPIPLRGQMYFGRAIRALATIFIGLSFFVSAMWMNKDEDDLRFTVQWILAGLCLDLAWSALQQITFMGFLKKEMVTHWQLAFSMRELVRSNRVSGLAYEPAWLAGQLATIFFPFLFAATLTNYRVTKFKWLEPALLILSLGVLLATYSRGGLLTTIAAAALTFLLLGRDVISALWKWFVGGFRARLWDVILRVGLILSALGILAGAFIFLSQKEYISRLWQIDAESLSEYIVDIKAGARGAYTSGAYAAFEDHPWTGVGFGASGFYIYQNLPDWTLTTVPEIAKQLSPENRLYPNPKNLYVRLLAETGFIGFILYLAFQFYVLGDILSLLRHNQAWARFAVTSGVFAWMAITFYNFTQDSLATPNLWLVAGALVGLSANSLLKENS
jgi:O-antigen ligase